MFIHIKYYFKKFKIATKIADMFYLIVAIATVLIDLVGQGYVHAKGSVNHNYYIIKNNLAVEAF